MAYEREKFDFYGGNVIDEILKGQPTAQVALRVNGSSIEALSLNNPEKPLFRRNMGDIAEAVTTYRDIVQGINASRRKKGDCPYDEHPYIVYGTENDESNVLAILAYLEADKQPKITGKPLSKSGRRRVYAPNGVSNGVSRSLEQDVSDTLQKIKDREDKLKRQFGFYKHDGGPLFRK
ncbi:MAG: hypothetical protein ABIC04_06715 [Nanoarchaeota archaeon]